MFARKLPLFASLLCVLALLAAGCATINTTKPGDDFAMPYSQTPDFETNPFWDGTGGGDYGTGLALADINGDNYPDMIVASGNDKALQQVQVFYNDTKGRFKASPDWVSRDSPLPGTPGEHNALIAVGDINGDGLNDVAVSIFLGPKNEYDRGGAKVYFNRGGTLEYTASWRVTGFPSFGLDLGDADGDGDLDLAVACGEPIPSEESWATQPCDAKASAKRKVATAATRSNSNPQPPYKVQNRIYYNNGGTLSTTPGWLSDDQFVAMGCIFADANADGLMDVVFNSAPVRIYLGQQDGTIATTPGWTSNDVNYYGNGIDFARTMHAPWSPRKDDVPSLALSANNYVGNGRGGFSLYRFLDPYIIRHDPRMSWPEWQSAKGGWGSAILFADMNDDGNQDILTHRWNEPGRNDLDGTLLFYLGNDATLSPMPTWNTTATSVIEAIRAVDLDLRDVQPDTTTFTVSDEYTGKYWNPGQQAMKVVYLNRQIPLHIQSVAINGQTTRGYAWVPGRNWISLATPLLKGDTVVVRYFYSPQPDIVYTNWNCNKGNYIYYRRN